ncbi:MAG: hypothetical protein ACFB16_11170 [Phormidesmis sp.]
MQESKTASKAASPSGISTSQVRLWSWIVGVLIGLGIVFRVTNLAQPVYWVDEVATTMRVSGYTHAEVRAQVATAQPLSTAELQNFQTIRSDKPLSDLSRVLSQSPEHAPLYFILARFWAALFGTSPTAMRSLPVLFSLLGLPAIYQFCKSLFFKDKTVQSSHLPEVKPAQRSRLIGKSAMGLLAISPFFVAYAQEARPYSLWILLLLITNHYLWQSLHTHKWQHWLAYTFTLILTLYTSLLTVLIVIGQTLAVITFTRRIKSSSLLTYLATTAAALIALLPWCYIVLTHWQTLQTNTAWMTMPASIWATFGTWFYSLAVLLFDVPVAQMPLIFGLQVIIATTTLALIGYATYVLVRQTSQPVWLFTLASSLAIPFSLLAIDLLRNGQAAATPRYLMPTHLGILIMLAYWLRGGLFSNSIKRRAALSFLLVMGLVSCLITQPSPYLKSRNLSNADLTALLNAESAPQLITTPHYIQDLISLSYQLEPDITFYVLPEENASPQTVLTEKINPQRPTFLFAPSAAMQKIVKDQQLGQLQSVYQPPPLISGGFALTLWEIRNEK